jgi:hypothetical protein
MSDVIRPCGAGCEGGILRGVGGIIIGGGG